MNTVKLKNRSAKVIAHRGVSGFETENTAAAFVAAANRSYYGIETDVRITKDGYFVLFHDDTLKRVANVDKPIKKLTMKKVNKIVLKDLHGRGVAERCDLRIPTIDDYINICKRYSKMAILEIKSRFTSKEIKKLMDKINEQDYLENTVFISFDWNNLIDIKSINENQKAQFLTSKCSDEMIEKLKNHKIDLDISYRSVTQELIEKLHNNGIEINVWTCDNLEEGNMLISNGVDYITTNILE